MTTTSERTASAAARPRAGNVEGAPGPELAPPVSTARDSTGRLLPFLVPLLAALVAVLSARSWVGGWNDASRLATVESLLHRGTIAIDGSLFADAPRSGPTPFHEGPASPSDRGTLDRLRFQGRFYSDKPPVPALLLAGLYAPLRWAGALDAHAGPGPFVRAMTIAGSGLPYVAAVVAVQALARRRLGDARRAAAVAAAFAFGTLAAAHTRHLNASALLLGLLAGLALGLDVLGEREPEGRRSPLLVAGLGLLLGLAYATDAGLGPLLVAATAVAVAALARRPGPVLLLLAAALPLVALHHVLNRVAGGTFLPANADPGLLLYPGSPFTARGMSGVLGGHGPVRKAAYAVELLAGKKGLLLHDPLLLLPLAAIPALVARLRDARPLRLVVLWALAVMTGSWLLYALFTTNSGGVCLSIRWLVPLLAPGFLLVVLALEARPALWLDLVLLAAWGAAFAMSGWLMGPWAARVVPGWWLLGPGAGLSWGALLLSRARARRRRRCPSGPAAAGT